MNYNLIMTPIVGAVIGYTTNWVAIKMLFRPYTEKRILGIKLPFTPGLIPNERARIALAIGEVVEQYLLTEEVILSELTSETVENSIMSYFKEESHIKEGHIELSLFFKDEEELQQLGHLIANMICERIFEAIYQKEFLESTKRFIKDKLSELLKEKSIKSLALANKEPLNNILNQILGSEDIRKGLSIELEKIISTDQNISEFIGPQLKQQIFSLIQFNEPKIKSAILEILKSEDVTNQGKEMVSTVISNKFGALGAMFANPASIYESIVDIAEEKINSMDLTVLVKQYSEEVFNKSFSYYIPEASRGPVADQIVGQMFNSVLIEKVQAYIYSMDQSLYQCLDTILLGDLEQQLDAFSLSIGNYLKETAIEYQEQIRTGIKAMILQVFHSSISITDSGKEIISNKIIEVYHIIIKKFVTKLIAKMKLSKIIEKQINSFKIDMFEEVILTIVKKELSAITWLGALLGFIMSIVLLFFK